MIFAFDCTLFKIAIFFHFLPNAQGFSNDLSINQSESEFVHGLSSLLTMNKTFGREQKMKMKNFLLDLDRNHKQQLSIINLKISHFVFDTSKWNLNSQIILKKRNFFERKKQFLFKIKSTTATITHQITFDRHFYRLL